MHRKTKDMSRRSFLEATVKGAGTFCLLSASPWDFMHTAVAASQAKGLAQGDWPRLSYRAYRGLGKEGSWLPTNIEGQIPAALRGTLYRNGAGAKAVYGTDLKHLFDGDALISLFRFEDGKISARSKFVETPERITERNESKMLYNEFGTASPNRSRGFKNSPSIHVMNLHGKVLAFSEASLPTSVDPETLETKGAWNFSGTFPASTTFTAHPKIDPVSGDAYAYGITMGMMPALKAFRIDRQTGKAIELQSFSLGGFYPVHDMLITKNYLIFVIPPIYVNMMGAVQGTKPIADLLNFEPSKPLRFVLMRKDGTGRAQVLTNGPAAVIFHHANAYEDEQSGKVVIHSLLAEDMRVYDLVKAWSQEKLPAGPKSWITRFELDLAKKTVTRELISDGTPTDFPCVDLRMLGQPIRNVYALEVGNSEEDPLAFNAIACWDIQSRSVRRVRAESGQMFGEPVFTPYPESSSGEAEGWLLHMGFDSGRDESFLDIRRAEGMELEARIWLGRFLPLGFHGSFSAG